MTTPLSRALLAAALLAVALPATAQSLGDLAKKEAERKKTAPPAAKTYTNDDLKQVPPAPGSPSAKAADGKDATDKDKEAGKAAGAVKTGDSPEKVDSTKAPEPAKDEAYWRGKITSAREDLRRNEAFKEALQTRVNALSADFASRDDPYQRAKIADDRQKALAEMARLTEEIDKGNKSIADIEEEARRAGVPPGWIR